MADTNDNGRAAAASARTIPLLSCGIFRFELEKILPEIEAELGGNIEAVFLAAGLDAAADKLEAEITENLNTGIKALLYGSMCHSELERITGTLRQGAKRRRFLSSGTSGAVYPKEANCVEIILGTEKKRELDAAGNVYYLTMGGLKLWREIYRGSHGWEEADARVNFGYFEKVVVLDTGIFEIAEEDLFEFFEYTQIPVEIMPVSLDHFKSVVLGLCRGDKN
jgi:hypothetical protein